MKVRASIKKRSCRLQDSTQKRYFMLLIKRILDLNKDKDKLWQEYQE